MAKSWTIEELHEELARFERELIEAGLKPNSVHTYVDRSARFLRWLVGDFRPAQLNRDAKQIRMAATGKLKSERACR